MIWYIELISIDHICIHLSTWRSNHWISREFIHSRGGPRAQPCSCWPAGRGAAGCTSRNLWSRSAQRHWDVGQKKLTWLWGVQCYGEILTDLLSLYIFINIHTVYIYIYIHIYILCIHIYIYFYILCIYIYIHIYILCIHIYIYFYILCIYIYLHIHIHTV